MMASFRFGLVKYGITGLAGTFFIIMWSNSTLASQRKVRLQLEEPLMCQEISVFQRLHQQDNSTNGLNSQYDIPPPPYCIRGFKGQAVSEPKKAWTIIISRHGFEKRETYFRVKVGSYKYWVHGDAIGQ